MKPNKRFKIKYIKHGRGNWSCQFWIDHQGFTIVTGRTRFEARWFGRNLKYAFEKIEFKKGSEEPTDE